MSALTDEIRTAVRDALREELPRALALAFAEARATSVDVTKAGLVDVNEAARRLGLRPSTVYKRAESVELASVKLGRRLLFRPADLADYADARRRTPMRVREIVAAARNSDRQRTHLRRIKVPPRCT